MSALHLVFHLSPQDGHVIIISGCLVLTAVNSSSRMAYMTDRLVPICERSNMTFDIGLHVVGVRTLGVRTLHISHNQIF